MNNKDWAAQERRERGGGRVVRRRAGVLPGARCARGRPARALRRAGRGAAARAQAPAPRPRRAAALTAPSRCPTQSASVLSGSSIEDRLRGSHTE